MYSVKFALAQIYGVEVSIKWDTAAIYREHNLCLISGTVIFDARGDTNIGFVGELNLDPLKIVKAARS